MKWEGNRESDNVEDRRDEGGGGGALGGLLGGRSIGIGTIVVALVGGWIFGITAGLDELLKVATATTKIVPSQGPVMTRNELEAQHKMYTAIAQRLRTLLFGGRNIDDALAARPTQEYDGQMGDPKQFIRLAFQSMWGHFTPDA